MEPFGSIRCLRTRSTTSTSSMSALVPPILRGNLMTTATNNITPHCRRGLITALLGLLTWTICQNSAIAQEPTLLLRHPALSEQHIAFVYGGDLWISNLDGTNPRRLSSHPATESSPKFSPDGKWIAFSANYESNMDVYCFRLRW